MGSHQHHGGSLDGQKLYWAVVINVLLTVVQLVAGVLSGSLSLMADALHNFSDAGALVVAAVARKIARLPRNESMTYGYKRAEILGTLINSTMLAVVGIYLLYEAAVRFMDPGPIEGWTVVWVASIALVIDVGTAFLTYSGSKRSLNIKAAFIHNMSDALASVAVILAGVFILLYQAYWVDLFCTVLISLYVIYHSIKFLKECVQILMQGAPSHIDVSAIKKAIGAIDGVESSDHCHIWQLNERSFFLEAHVSTKSHETSKIMEIQKEIEARAKELGIGHITVQVNLEEEFSS